MSPINFHLYLTGQNCASGYLWQQGTEAARGVSSFPDSTREAARNGLEISVKEWMLSGSMTKMRSGKVKSEFLNLAVDILD